MTDGHVEVSPALELTCERCPYQVSSGTAGQWPPAERAMPDECRQCGGDLVPAGRTD